MCFLQLLILCCSFPWCHVAKGGSTCPGKGTKPRCDTTATTSMGCLGLGFCMLKYKREQMKVKISEKPKKQWIKQSTDNEKVNSSPLNWNTLSAMQAGIKQVFLPSGMQPREVNRVSHPSASGSCSVQSILPPLEYRPGERGLLILQRFSPFCCQREHNSEQGCASPRAYFSHALKKVGSRAGRGNGRSQGAQYGMLGYVPGTHHYWSMLFPRLPLLGWVQLVPWFDSSHPSGKTEKLAWASSGETETYTVSPSLMFWLQTGLGGVSGSALLPGACLATTYGEEAFSSHV